MAFPLRAASFAALATILIACGGDEASNDASSGDAVSGEPDQSALRQLILAADAPPQPAEQATKENGQETQIKNENGVSQECVYKRFTGTALYETLVSFDPNADSIWPGAIAQTKTLPQGLAAPIGLPRRPGTITLSDAVIAGGAEAKYSRTLKEPSLAATREAVAGMFTQGAVRLAAKSNYLAETAYSMNEASVKMGVAVSWMNGSVKANFAGSWLSKKTTMIVRFVQAYYTVSFAAPPSPEKVFGPLVTADDARPYMGPGNPPAYVSSVTYGRMLIMKVETDESERDLRAALDLAFNKVNVDIDVASKNVLKNSTFSVFVLGGSPDDAARIQASDSESRAAALGSYIQNGANFDPKSPGVPISYTMRRLADNETLKVSSTIDYQVPVCTPAALNVALDLQSFYVRKDGKAGGSTTGSYEVWMENPTSAGGALPPTPGEQDKSKRESLAKGTASIDDGGSVALGLKSFARVASQQGATLTIGAKIHSDAKGKECEMTRTHSYRFNPKTNVGEWTNTGVNTQNCAVKDSALLGDNSLDVDLRYAFTP
ncbi:MAG TPA: thiol-activated cytolysin family protein [Labilithrix sp.]|nr:thiol-activated cytolysin family protein [Labilithrix sp.]